MNKHTLIGSVLAISFALSGGVALAQTTTTAGGLTFTSTPVTTPVGAGTGMSLGAFTIGSANASSTSIATIPLTITPGNGGQLGNLSNCLVYSSAGTVVSTPFTPLSGVNTVTLLNPITVGGAVGAAGFTLRCDVGAGVPNGATFLLAAGPSTGSTGTTGTATTTAVNGLAVNLDTAPSVPAGSMNVALANLWLGGATLSSAGRIGSVPVTITAGNGASVSNLTSCSIRSAIDGTGGALSNTAVITNGGQTTFALLSPLALAASGNTMLALACDVQPSAPVGGTFTISVAPGSFVATDLAGNPIPVFAAVGFGPSGLPASTSGTVTVTALGTAPVQPGSGTGAGTTPGVPNTGAGGAAGAFLFVLALAALAAAAGAAYLTYEKKLLD